MILKKIQKKIEERIEEIKRESQKRASLCVSKRSPSKIILVTTSRNARPRPR
jgi:hypothetical protein